MSFLLAERNYPQRPVVNYATRPQKADDQDPGRPKAKRFIRELTMFIAISRPAVEPKGPDAVAVPYSPAVANDHPRALHARLMQNAALRRRRGLERKHAGRPDDAAYWLGAAPLALRKAAELRLGCRLGALP